MQMNSSAVADISFFASFGFVILILTTVGGNTLVLLALFLDKRLHTPSFYLIANMAVADLLLGLAVLPFSSVLELLKDQWIFGQGFCSAWLALDVLCCTASIVGLMAVSIDRYIGVTRPLNYGSIMTTRRTIYLVIIVWAVSILTSVVPLFGLTDREKRPVDDEFDQERYETCKVNKNTFYTIFSSMMSFYIPAVILLFLYSRVYQEAKAQGKKLETEKRRLYEIDYQIASEHLRRKQSTINRHASEQALHELHRMIPKGRNQRSQSHVEENSKEEPSVTIEENGNSSNNGSNHDFKHQSIHGVQFKRGISEPQSRNRYDDTVQSESSLAQHLSCARRSLVQRISSTFRRQSQPNDPQSQHARSSNALQMSHNDELMIIKRKLNNLKHEKKAFRTLGLILGALLICWLPFFVTLPAMSILKHYGMIDDENKEHTWFKITFWLGYCNSALNPFVYAFSNRAIRRAFREVLFRRFCCCNLQCSLCRYFCSEKVDQTEYQYHRTRSNSFGAQTVQVTPRRTSSFSFNPARPIPIVVNGTNSKTLTNEVTTNSGPTVSFADTHSLQIPDEISFKDEIQSNSLTSIQITSLPPVTDH